MANCSFVCWLCPRFNRQVIDALCGYRRPFFLVPSRGGYNVFWIRESKARPAAAKIECVSRSPRRWWLVIGARAPITLEKVNVTGEGFRMGLRNQRAIPPVTTLSGCGESAGKTLSSPTVCDHRGRIQGKRILAGEANRFLSRENSIFLEKNLLTRERFPT